jgi:hypothetical protein
MFVLWLDKAGVDASSIAALELLITKRMTKDSKRRAHQCVKPVVVVARGALLQSLGMVFGGIAARCQEAQDARGVPYERQMSVRDCRDVYGLNSATPPPRSTVKSRT